MIQKDFFLIELKSQIELKRVYSYITNKNFDLIPYDAFKPDACSLKLLLYITKIRNFEGRINSRLLFKMLVRRFCISAGNM